MLICQYVVDFSLKLLVYFVISYFHCFNRLLFRVNGLHWVVVCLSIFETFYSNRLPFRGLWCYGSRFSVLIDYCIILISYMFGLKLFLAFCSVVLDYDFVLICWTSGLNNLKRGRGWIKFQNFPTNKLKPPFKW